MSAVTTSVTPEDEAAAAAAAEAKAAKVAAVRARKEAALLPNPLKDLKVKISVVVRMDKEVAFYQQEAVENEAIVKKLEDAGKDAYDMKQAKECLQESYMMIPDSKNRHQKALEDLHGFLDENASDPSVAGTPTMGEAIALLQEHGMPFESAPEAEVAGGEEFAEGEIF